MSLPERANRSNTVDTVILKVGKLPTDWFVAQAHSLRKEHDEILQTTELIDSALKNKDNDSILSEIKEKVKNLCVNFPIYKK